MPAGIQALDFGVYLEQPDGSKLFTRVSAETPNLAIIAAEAQHPGCRAVSILWRRDVAGRCARCRVVLFQDEYHRRAGRNGSTALLCVDC